MKSRSTFLRKTLQVAVLTGISRFMGIARSAFQLRFLGLGVMSDAFLAAWTIPSFLRRVVTEGALASAFVPEFVSLLKANRKQTAYSLMVWALIFFELLMIGAAITTFIWPESLLTLVAPGFSEQQLIYAVPLVRILFIFMIFLTASALLVGALNSVHSFWVGASGPIVLNGFYMLGLAYCFYTNASVTVLAWWIVAGGFMHMLLHLFYYWYNGFSFVWPDRAGLKKFGYVVTQIIPAFLGVSMLELNITIDKRWGSYLLPGAMTMIHYGNRFMGLPFGIFAVAFSTVILPLLSEVAVKNRSRLSFYLQESYKLILWIMIPLIALMWFIAPNIYESFLVAGTSPEKIMAAAWVLRIYLIGLLFYCANRVMLALLYALRDRTLPTLGTIFATAVNIAGNMIAVRFASVNGVALATTIAAGAMTFFILLSLGYRHKVGIKLMPLVRFLLKVLAHSLLVGLLFYLLFFSWQMALSILFPSLVQSHYLFWTVLGLIVSVVTIVWVKTYQLFGIKVYFLS